MLLIEEARNQLAADPREALAWLDLAAEVVKDLGVSGFPVRALVPFHFRIAAHRANTLRVLGELPAADRIFRDLAADPWRGELAHLGDLAELRSLEAALRIDPRRREACAN